MSLNKHLKHKIRVYPTSIFKQQLVKTKLMAL